jgi:hypothetical protein
MALLSSIFALESFGASAAFSAVLLPTKRRFGCLWTGVGSSGIPSSVEGPKFVAARSSSMFVARKWCFGKGDVMASINCGANILHHSRRFLG